MSRFRRGRLEIVVAAIDVHDGKRGELSVRKILQRAYEHSEGLFAFRLAHASEQFDAAVPAELMLDALGAELIRAERVLPAQDPEIRAIDSDQPRSRLAANRTIALHRALAQIDTRFIPNRTAVTATR